MNEVRDTIAKTSTCWSIYESLAFKTGHSDTGQFDSAAKQENAYQPDITKQKFLCKDCWSEGSFRFDIFDGW